MKTVLFVCTGNTCRSPMAGCLFNAFCERQGDGKYRAVSAGLQAFPGEPASNGALRAMERRGLNLQEHHGGLGEQGLSDRLYEQSPCGRTARTVSALY